LSLKFDWLIGKLLIQEHVVLGEITSTYVILMCCGRLLWHC